MQEAHCAIITTTIIIITSITVRATGSSYSLAPSSVDRELQARLRKESRSSRGHPACQQEDKKAAQPQGSAGVSEEETLEWHRSGCLAGSTPGTTCHGEAGSARHLVLGGQRQQ